MNIIKKNIQKITSKIDIISVCIILFILTLRILSNFITINKNFYYSALGCFLFLQIISIILELLYMPKNKN